MGIFSQRVFECKDRSESTFDKISGSSPLNFTWHPPEPPRSQASCCPQSLLSQEGAGRTGLEAQPSENGEHHSGPEELPKVPQALNLPVQLWTPIRSRKDSGILVSPRKIRIIWVCSTLLFAWTEWFEVFLSVKERYSCLLGQRAVPTLKALCLLDSVCLTIPVFLWLLFTAIC